MLSELQNVLSQGGFILWALLALGILLYSMLFVSWQALLKVKSENKDQKFIANDRREIVREFAVMELDQLAWVERRIPMITVLVGAAPLAGLLGTVSGMLSTFSGLASRSTAQPIDKISVGISEALVTTQAGLLIAIPAAFLLAFLKNKTQSAHSELQQCLHHALIDHHTASTSQQ